MTAFCDLTKIASAARRLYKTLWDVIGLAFDATIGVDQQIDSICPMFWSVT